MVASNMKFMVRSPDGKEYGPVDQDTLIQWAQDGRITEHYEIRNALMKKGNPANNVPFLRDIMTRQKAIKDRNRPFSTRIASLVDPEFESEYQQRRSLGKGGGVQFTPGSSGLRFLAWLIDTSILAGIGALLFAVVSFLVQSLGNKGELFTAFTLGVLLCIFMYYTISIGMTAQTAGQWVAGLMVIRKKGGPVLMGRAFVFSVCYLIFFWSTLLFSYCLPSKRAIQDTLSGVRVVKITAD